MDFCAKGSVSEMCLRVNEYSINPIIESFTKLGYSIFESLVESKFDDGFQFSWDRVQIVSYNFAFSLFWVDCSIIRFLPVFFNVGNYI